MTSYNANQDFLVPNVVPLPDVTPEQAEQVILAYFSRKPVDDDDGPQCLDPEVLREIVAELELKRLRETKDIPEATEDWFKNAQLVLPT